MTPIEDRIRGSLHQRAEDVEPTPQLWQEVDRRISRRRWRTAGGWTVATAGLAAAAALVVPGLLGGQPAVPVIEPGVTPGVGTVPAVVVIAEGDGLALLDLRSGERRPLANQAESAGRGTVVDIAVRPGSTAGDYDVAAVRVADDGVSELLFEHQVPDAAPGGGAGRLPEHAVAPGFVASVGWAPAEHLLVYTVPADADGAVLVVQPVVGDSFPDTAIAQELAVVERDARVLDWVGEVTSPGDRSLLHLRRPDGDVVALELLVGDDGSFTAGDSSVVAGPDGGSVLDVAYAGTTGAASALDRYALVDVDGGLVLAWSPAGDPVATWDVQVDLGDVLPERTTQMRLDASGDAVLIGDGSRLWLFVHDGAGTFRDPVELEAATGTGALFGVPVREGPAPGEDPQPDPLEQPSTGTPTPGDTGLVEPVLVAGPRDLRLLEADGTDTLLHTFPEEGGSHVMGLAVRPGSTVDRLMAVVLTTAEGMWDLRELRVVDGEVSIEVFPPAYRPGVGTDPGAGFVVTGPVWYEDGSSVAWIETGPGGATLRTVGWTDDGLGTGDDATDNASFVLPEAPLGVVLRPAQWLDVAMPGTRPTTEIRAVADDPQDGWYAITLERQADGAWARPADASGVVERTLPDLTAQVLAVAGRQAQDPSVPAWVVQAGPSGTTVVHLDAAGDAVTIGLPDDLLPGEGLPTVWALEVGDVSLVGSPSTAVAYLVTVDGQVTRHADVAWADTLR